MIDPGVRKRRRWWRAILLVLAAMIALAAWAWWIPNGVFNPWLAKARLWLHLRK
jgi:ferric-dicitrate binding protein FerR (iron transport regulator)